MDAASTARHPLPVRLLTVRLVAVLWALTWWVFPGFGLIDLSVTWDQGWPVVLEASWGVFMTVLVGGSFLVVAVRPGRAAPRRPSSPSGRRWPRCWCAPSPG